MQGRPQPTALLEASTKGRSVRRLPVSQLDYATYAILITHMRFHIAKWSERLRIHALRLYDRRSRDFRS